MSLAPIPKVELHLHLRARRHPTLIRRIAAEKRADISRAFGPDGGYAFDDFARFLEVYEAATSVLTTPEDYHRLTLAVLEASAARA